jgi:hypothetical protein
MATTTTATRARAQKVAGDTAQFVETGLQQYSRLPGSSFIRPVEHVPGKWVPTATFPGTEPPKEFEQPDLIAQYLYYAMQYQQPVQLIGPPGIGKTSHIREILATIELSPRVLEEFGLPKGTRGAGLRYMNAANMTPEDVIQMTPVKNEDGEVELHQLITEELSGDYPWFWMIDDLNQSATVRLVNQLMEAIRNGQPRLGGMPLKGCVGIVLADNEGRADGVTMTRDPAQGDRPVTLVLTANDTRWRYALARKYSTTDLSGVFRVWDSLEPQLRRILSPRTLDHVIYAGLKGFPLIWALPILNGKRVQLQSVTDNGEFGPNRTGEILDSIAKALGVTNRDRVPDAARKVIQAAIQDRLTVLIQGPPGCGKTELARSELAAAGLRTVYKPMATTDPDTMVMPIPSHDGTLRMAIAEEFVAEGDYGVIWDEYNRPAYTSAFSKLMEMTQEWTLAGKPMERCRAQIALQNPPEWMGQRMHVMRNNLAQASRFTLSIEVTPDDIPANEWLINTYGEVAETFLEWYKNDLPDEGREWITKRTLERLITLHLAGLPMEPGLMYLGNGDYAPVSLVDLVARLADRPMAGLAEIAANLPEWETRLAGADEIIAGTQDTEQVHRALAFAEVPQLQRHEDAVVRLLRYLQPNLRTSLLVGVSKEKQEFWVRALKRFSEMIKAEQDAAIAEVEPNLVATYGDVAKTFLTWYRSDLDINARRQVNLETLEELISTHVNRGDLGAVLGVKAGDPAAAQRGGPETWLASLQARLG